MKLIHTLFLSCCLFTPSSFAQETPEIVAGQALSSEQVKSLGFIDTTSPILRDGDRIIFSLQGGRLILEAISNSRDVQKDGIVESAAIRWTFLKGDYVSFGIRKLEQKRKVMSGDGGSFSSSLGGEKITIKGVVFSWRVDDSPNCIIFDLKAGVLYHLLQNKKGEQVVAPDGE